MKVIKSHSSDTSNKKTKQNNSISQGHKFKRNVISLILSAIAIFVLMFVYTSEAIDELQTEYSEKSAKLHNLSKSLGELNSTFQEYKTQDSLKLQQNLSELSLNLKKTKALYETVEQKGLFTQTFLKLNHSIKQVISAQSLSFINPERNISKINIQHFPNIDSSLKTLQNKINKAELSLPLSLNKKTRNLYLILVSVTFFLAGVVIVSFLFEFYKLSYIIANTKRFISTLSQGKLPKRLKERTYKNNGLRVVGNKLMENLKEASQFAKDIGEGEFNSKFNPASKEDDLGNSLVRMREQLKKVSEEDRQRNWVNEGKALFGKILRKSNKDLTEQSNDIISELVKYCDCNQGAVYLCEEIDQEHKLLMKACYAYGRKKHISQSIDIGEGIIGQAFLDKSMVYMTEIPGDYLNIRSGLGESKPKCIILVPLINNEKIEGIIELASFKELETYEIDFLNQIATDISSSINSIRTNEQTQKLLKESQFQAESLRVQEEELRQNMEELRATHEQMERLKKETERHSEEKIKQAKEHNNFILSIINRLPSKIFLKDEEFKMLLINDAVCEAHGMTRKELIGKSDEDFFGTKEGRLLIEEEQAIIRGGKPITWEHEDLAQGKRKVMRTTKMPFKLEDKNKYGLLGFQVDVTEKVMLEQKIQTLEGELSDLKISLNRA